MNPERLLRGLRTELAEGGLRGSLLVRDLTSGRELGIEPDTELPVASLVKVPLAAITCERIRCGALDGAAPVRVEPGHNAAPGTTGLSRFQHPASIGIDDLLYLSTAISDGVAADALFELTPPVDVTRGLQQWQIYGITARHLISELNDTPAQRLDTGEVSLAHSLAIAAGTADRGHQVAQLDVSRANSGSARAFVDLLQALWRPSAIDPAVAGRVRELMGQSLLRHRLAPDFSSDVTTWSSKTGTLLNLRHEVGVVEHADGESFAVAALTESRVPAQNQPEAELLMARVARALRDCLRYG